MITLAALAMSITASLSTPCGSYELSGPRPGFATDSWIRTLLEQACTDAHTQGYRWPDKPALTSITFTQELPGSHTAGAWLPQKIFLPAWSRDPEQLQRTLRHEWMHGLTQAVCHQYPIWAHEAAAMSFSGELLQRLNASRVDQPADDREEQKRLELGRLLLEYGWPTRPCSLQKDIAKTWEQKEKPVVAPPAFAWRIIHLASGRSYAAAGGQKELAPAGSLLKLAWFAALPPRVQDETAVQAAILRSDSDRLWQLTRNRVNRQRLMEALKFSGSSSWQLAPEQMPGAIDQRLQAALGERTVLFSLENLTLMLRHLILGLRSESLQFLSNNGRVAASTLALAAPEGKNLLHRMHALAKTGTNKENEATTWGNLMVLWPKERPEFLAVFRAPKRRGADVLSLAEPILLNFIKQYPVDQSLLVHVELDTRKVPHTLEDLSDCAYAKAPATLHPTLGQAWQSAGKNWIYSPCRHLQLLTQTRSAAYPRKKLQGLLAHEGTRWTLLTDLETYTDAVLHAEGSSLRGAARSAFRAIIFSNGSFRRKSICASTRCMVFIGQPEMESQEQTARPLRDLASSLVTTPRDPWLYFSAGGSKPWTRKLSHPELTHLLASTPLINLERITRRHGEIAIRLITEQTQTELTCDQFQTRLKLPSCPSEITYGASAQQWIFQGLGEGHGRGYSLDEAQKLADSGWDAARLLQWAYASRTSLTNRD